jgi:hypothetical protein
MTTVEREMTLHRYWDLASRTSCSLKSRCTTAKGRRITRWEHEAVVEAMQERLDRAPNAMRVRRATGEHPFGALKAWMGATAKGPNTDSFTGPRCPAPEAPLGAMS